MFPTLRHCFKNLKESSKPNRNNIKSRLRYSPMIFLKNTSMYYQDALKAKVVRYNHWLLIHRLVFITGISLLAIYICNADYNAK